MLELNYRILQPFAITLWSVHVLFWTLYETLIIILHIVNCLPLETPVAMHGCSPSIYKRRMTSLLTVTINYELALDAITKTIAQILGIIGWKSMLKNKSLNIHCDLWSPFILIHTISFCITKNVYICHKSEKEDLQNQWKGRY